MPDWMSNLEDLYIVQGDQLEHRFNENVNFFGDKTNVKFRMREANIFARYDEIWHSFVVNSTAIPDSMIGIHKITVETTYVDPKGQAQFFTKSFYLHVEADSVREEKKE